MIYGLSMIRPPGIPLSSPVTDTDWQPLGESFVRW
jgi:hypothetical protein